MISLISDVYGFTFKFWNLDHVNLSIDYFNFIMMFEGWHFLNPGEVWKKYNLNTILDLYQVY